MHKSELIDLVQGHLGGTQREAKQALDAVLESIGEGLAAGGSIVLVGFGTFTVKARAAATRRNPQTGDPVAVPAKKLAAFKPGKELQARLNS